MLNQTHIISQLTYNAASISHLIAGVSDEQARWKPTEQTWSLLEVINHLYDEEREDFRMRVDFVLHKPGEQPPGIDPEGWVTVRSYNQRNLTESLDNFLAERRQSIAWLQTLEAPNWDNAYIHPAGFTLRAGDLLTSWLAHDFLHLRQLVELHYAWVQRTAAPYDIRYAGEW